MVVLRPWGAPLPGEVAALASDQQPVEAVQPEEGPRSPETEVAQSSAAEACSMAAPKAPEHSDSSAGQRLVAEYKVKQSVVPHHPLGAAEVGPSREPDLVACSAAARTCSPETSRYGVAAAMLRQTEAQWKVTRPAEAHFPWAVGECLPDPDQSGPAEVEVT